MLEIGINKQRHQDWESTENPKDDWIEARIDDLLDEYNIKDATRIAEEEWEAQYGI
jgi:hypothetical protein